MKKKFWLLFLSLALALTTACTCLPGWGCGSQPTGSSQVPARPAPAVVTYRCPMHPEVVSNSPGTCPKCGMQLEVKN